MALAKGGYRYFTGSIGMISDGLHSTLHAAGGIVGLAISLLDPLMRHILTVMSDTNCLQRWASPLLCWQRCGGILDDAWTRFHSHEVPRVTGL